MTRTFCWQVATEAAAAAATRTPVSTPTKPIQDTAKATRPLLVEAPLGIISLNYFID